MCDYCPRVMHLGRCARLKANYRGEYKCPNCEEEGNQTKTKGSRRGTLGKDHNQASKNKGKRRTNINDRRIPGSSTEGHKRE